MMTGLGTVFVRLALNNYCILNANGWSDGWVQVDVEKPMDEMMLEVAMLTTLLLQALSCESGSLYSDGTSSENRQAQKDSQAQRPLLPWLPPQALPWLPPLHPLLHGPAHEALAAAAAVPAGIRWMVSCDNRLDEYKKTWLVACRHMFDRSISRCLKTL